MANTILVTGSTGTVGSEVVKQLAAAGATIRAAVQATSKTDRLSQAGAVPFGTNFTDPQSLRAALEGVEKAFLLTPVIPDQADAAARFVAASKAAGLKHLVKLSAIGADSDLDYQFVKEHRQSEQAIKDSFAIQCLCKRGSKLRNLGLELSLELCDLLCMRVFVTGYLSFQVRHLLSELRA